MENIIKVGVGILIIHNDKILLGHRVSKYKDTGGIYEPDSWTLPGGKQEFSETIKECIIRETKEETNLDINDEDITIFNVTDDIQPDKHFITIHSMTNKFFGDLLVMEKDKIDEWKWFKIDSLPDNIYSPSKKTIEEYLKL